MTGTYCLLPSNSPKSRARAILIFAFSISFQVKNANFRKDLDGQDDYVGSRIF